MAEPDVSIVAAAHNEQDNLSRLVREIADAMHPVHGSFELVIVDDGSTDRTPALLAEIAAGDRRVRVITMTGTPPGRGHGQSAAFHAGIHAARGDLVVMLDADCQNDPTDIPPMIDRLRASGADMIQGDRSADRRDSPVRRASSRVGRLVRRVLLGDTIRDTGCSLRVMRRAVARALPLELRGMHRFIPATARQLGFTVIEMPVHHRPRTAGQTKYGVANRALPGLIDCLGIRWMGSRRCDVRFRELQRPGTRGDKLTTLREKAGA